MRLVLSAVIVFGLAGLLVCAALATDPSQVPLPVAWLIHSRTPWALLASAAAGLAVGASSLRRQQGWTARLLVAGEATVVAALALFFTHASFLPDRPLGVAVGDVFPSWTLLDQDGTSRSHVAPRGGEVLEDAVRRHSLYIFYRGDW